MFAARRRTWLEWLNPFARVQRWFTVFALFWLIAAATLLYLGFTRSGVKLGATLGIYLMATVVCSVASFAMYAVDKHRATNGKTRIPERTLHLFGALGGWPGAHLARRIFRHKTLKVSFRIVFWLIVAIHVGLIGYGMLFGWWVDAIRALISSW